LYIHQKLRGNGYRGKRATGIESETVVLMGEKIAETARNSRYDSVSL